MSNLNRINEVLDKIKKPADRQGALYFILGYVADDIPEPVLQRLVAAMERNYLP